MDVTREIPRNPGPSWLFAALRIIVRLTPAPLQILGGWIGASVSFVFMPGQRWWSRAYLEAILPRRPTWVDSWRHFNAFAVIMIAKLRASVGRRVDLVCEGEDKHRAGIIFSDEPLLLGTFHVGASDLLGFHISGSGRTVRMVRMNVANSGDLSALARTFGDGVGFVWVNDPDRLIFSLRDALESDATVALQCDRFGGVERGEPFRFLGKNRMFRTSIYRLSRVFGRKVLFCIATPEQGVDRFRIHVHECFDGSGLGRDEHRAAAHAHFQSVLDWLEAILRRNPYIWFNFLPLNPVAPNDPDARDAPEGQRPNGGGLAAP